jgi:glucose/arabinose dehydrogenase
MEQLLLFWSPSIALSGLAFYTGDKFPDWKGSVFVGGLVANRRESCSTCADFHRRDSSGSWVSASAMCNRVLMVCSTSSPTATTER